MNVGSVFSGIGGFDLACQRAGMTIVWQSEIDRAASAVLARQFPDTPNLGDVKNVRQDTVKPVDLVCGGFPCQDLSFAGQRAGLAGERSGLWFEFARVIAELKPRWVVIENVPGLLSSNGGRDMETIVRSLVEFGYGVAWRVLDAQYFGLAQRRKRVFIVGSLGSGRAAEILFEREGGYWNTPPSREAREGTANTTIINLANSGANQNNVKVTDITDTLDTWGTQAIAGTLDRKSTSSDRGSQKNETEFIVPFTVGALVERDYKGIGTTVDDKIVWEMSHASEAVRESGNLSPTLQQRMGTGGNQVPLVGVRRLTPTECERLQGFPDGWTEGQSDSARYRQLGNAVAVPVIEWIMRRVTGSG